MAVYQLLAASKAGARYFTPEADRLCNAAGLQVREILGRVFFDATDADWDQIIPLLKQFAEAPGAKEAVKALLLDDSRSAVAS